MKKVSLFLIVIIIVITIAITIFFYFKFRNEKQNNENQLPENKEMKQDVNNVDNNENKININETENNINTEAEKVDNNKPIEPIAEFEKRITKKPFGIYITPQNSPVQPERFQGYHTGSDVEYEDVENEVEVFSIADGNVILSRWVSGYGGFLAITHNINNENIISLYGHLNPDSLININSEVKKGDKIGILGRGFTNETDNERKHLHFAILKGSSLDLRGYVQSKGELDKWYNPIDYLNK